MESPAPHAPSRDEVLVWSGGIAFGVGLAASLAGIICAMILATRHTRHGAVVVIGLSIAASGAASVFLVAMPTDHMKGAIGWSARAFFGGAGGAFLGAVLAVAKVPLVRWQPLKK